MKRLTRCLAAVGSLLILLVAGTWGFLNTSTGFRCLESTVPWLSDGEARLEGLSGRFPDKLRAERIEIIDPKGIWMTVHALQFDWSPLSALRGTAEVARLVVAHIEMARPSEYPEDPNEDNSLPFFFRFRTLAVEAFDLAPPVAGAAMRFHVEGSGEMTALDRISADLRFERTDMAGHYHVTGEANPESVRIIATVDEPPQGLLARLAQLPDLGRITGSGSMDGAWENSRVALDLGAGALRATATGTIDWTHDRLQLVTTLKSPGMSPRPDLTWQNMSIDASVSGPFSHPDASGRVEIIQLHSPHASIDRIAATIESGPEQIILGAEANGLRSAAIPQDLLAKHPLKFHASMKWAPDDGAIDFRLMHPLFNAEGTTFLKGPRRLSASLSVPSLEAILGAFGLPLKGNLMSGVKFADRGTHVDLDLDGKLSVTAGAAPLPALIGPAASLSAIAELRGAELLFKQLHFSGQALTVVSTGRLDPESVQQRVSVTLRDLSALQADLAGGLNAEGELSGPLRGIGFNGTLKGDMALRRMAPIPLNATLKVSGLPKEPGGTITGQGILEGAPANFAVSATVSKNRDITIHLSRVDWRSLHGGANLVFGPGVALPSGRADATVGALEDLRPFTGKTLRGEAQATVLVNPQAGGTHFRVQLAGHRLHLDGMLAADQLDLDAGIRDVSARNGLDAQLKVSGLSAKGIENGSLIVAATGAFDALSIRMKGLLPDLAESPGQLESSARIDLDAEVAELLGVRASWHDEVIQLHRPATLRFARGVQAERLSLIWRQAALDFDGRLAPELDFTADLRGVSGDSIRHLIPDFPVEGQLEASVRLSGPPSRPNGTAHINIDGIRGRTGAATGLPPASMRTVAQFDAGIAHVEGRLSAGSAAQLNVLGEVPMIQTQPINLRSEGMLDLKLLDPILQARGRRARGRVIVNGGIRGTLENPLTTGGLQLSNGEFEDYSLGMRLADMSASLQADGERMRIERLVAHAGPGRIDMGGSIGVLQRGLPLDLTLTARNAQPLASDRMTVTLDSNVTLRGEARSHLAANGRIHIRRAEIRIPERIPATISVLDVREPGAQPPPAPKPGPDVGVDLLIDATDEVFVRGRGLDAEMSGRVHILGTANNPQPNGRFRMRRGQFTLMGKTLTFSRGEVGFDGGTLTNPALDFLATSSSNNITATLAVGGTVRKPTISLSSVPELPQDEVLAQLLFGRGSSVLSPMELAQIAGALASLTGVTSRFSNPLESVRKGLGLDRLAVGSTKTGAPTLEAGRYVAPGVYLGAKQGFSGGSAIPQAAVQIDLTEGLKVEGTVGAGNDTPTATSTGASSAGMIYQFEY